MRGHENHVFDDEDRRFLSGRKTYDGEYARQNRYERRKAIRGRVYHSLQDGHALAAIDPDQRDAIFNHWRNAEEWVDSGFEHEAATIANREKWEFRRSLCALLRFLYLGIEESTEWAFDELLEQAITRAEAGRNNEVTEWEFNIEVDKRDDVNPLLRRFKNRDPSLDPFQIKSLQREGEIEDEDLLEYYDELSEPVNSS